MTSIKNTLKCLLVVFILGYLSQGCTIINPKEPTPTYVHIDSFTWDNSTATHGLSTSHQINTIWVYYNNSPVGVFDLPATFPVITSGNSGMLTITPGIAVNGLNNFNAKYPFYVNDTFTLATKPGEVVNHTPKTSYFPSIIADRIANFESGLVPFAKSDGNISMVSGSVPSLRFEGTYYGLISLTAANNDTLSEDSSSSTFPIALGSQAYIELNYRCTAPFYLGLRANLGSGVFYKTYLAGIFPTDHWQKFYFAVSDFGAQYTADSYTLFIKSALDPGVDSGQVFLDNIQLVHF